MARPGCNFELRQYDGTVPTGESISSDVFFVKFCTWARTLNHDEEISIGHNQNRLIQEETFLVQREHMLCDFKDAMPHICLWLLRMRIPSELQPAIAKKIHRFAVSMANEPHNSGSKILPILMNFTTLWFRPNVHDESIARLLAMPLEDPMQMATPATKTSIDALEKVRLEHLDLPTKCVICLEEFFIEENVIRMSCSHVYHENCIVQWLKKSHLCPLCRFEMPIV